MRFDLSRLTKPPARRLAGGVAINQPASAELMTPATPASGGDRGAVKANTGGLSPKSPAPPAKNSEPDRKIEVGCIQTVSPEPDVIEPWRQMVLDMLGTDPLKKYAIIVDNITTDPVMVSIGIRPIGTFQMAIPLQHYDSFKLLELVQNYITTHDARQGTRE